MSNNIYLTEYEKEKEKVERNNQQVLSTPSLDDTVKYFLERTENKIITKANDEKNVINSFDILNSVIFAGFDYYHYSVIGDMINENERLLGMDSNTTVLINKDHLYKLKQVIDCVPAFKFIIREDEEKQLHYSIWYKKSKVAINLVPFKRKENDIYIELNSYDNSHQGSMLVSESDHKSIPYKYVIGIDEDYNEKLENNSVKKLTYHLKKNF